MSVKQWNGTGGTNGDLNVAANWTPSGVPQAADDVYFDGSSTQAVTLSLTTFAAIALASLTFDHSYIQAVGTESAFMEVDAGVLTIGQAIGGGTGTGSPRLNLDLKANAQTVVIWDTASSATDAGRLPVRLKLVNAANNVFIHAGSVAIEDDPADSGQVAALNIDQSNTDGTSTTVIIGDGVTVATVNQIAGEVFAYSSPTTLNLDGGTFTKQLAGNITTATIRGGTFTYNGTGTITTLVLDGPGAVADFLSSQESRTVTNCTCKEGTIRLNKNDLTTTNNLDPENDAPVAVTFTKL